MWSRFFPRSPHSRKGASRPHPSFLSAAYLHFGTNCSRLVFLLRQTTNENWKNRNRSNQATHSRSAALSRTLVWRWICAENRTEPFALCVRVCPPTRLPRICPPRCLLAPTMATMNSSLLKTVLWENQTIELFHPSIATPYCLFPTNRRRLDRSKSIKQACRDGSMASNTFLLISKRISTLREQKLYHCAADCITVQMICYMSPTVKK